MRLSRRHREHDLGFRLTPLVDVVFLLIIFFMTISQISRTNAQWIQVPRVPPAWSEAAPVSISVTVDQAGRLSVSGEPLDIAGFDDWVARQLQGVAGDASRLQVLLRYDHRCTSEVLNELVRRLAARSITRVRLAVSPE